MIQLYVNGTELTNYIVATPFKDTIDDELDQFNFQLKSTTRLSFRKYDQVNYRITHNTSLKLNKIFCLFSYVEKLEGQYWTYQISCLSPTKILDNIIINGMAETYLSSLGNQTLYNQMVLIVDKINTQIKYEVGRGINHCISLTLANGVSSKLSNSACDFLWDGQSTAREILNDIADKNDCIVVATDYSIYTSRNEIIEIVIDVIPREKHGTELIANANDVEGGGLNALGSMVKGITYSRDSEFNCGNIISLMKNGIANNDIQQAYLPARNTDLTIDDASKWHIITNEPIYTLNEVKILVPSTLSQSYYVNNAQTVGISSITLPYSYGREEDITEYIVEKSYFDSMPISEQAKHLYFIRGERGIYGLFDRYKSGISGLFSHTAIYNILHDLQTKNSYPYIIINNGDVRVSYPILRFDTNNKEWTNNLVYTIKDGDWKVNDFFNLNLVNDDVLNEDYSKYSLFSINYQPYCDSVAKIEKTNLESNLVRDVSVIKNQSDRTIDATKYYDSQEALINRLGNQEMQLDCMVDLTTTPTTLNSLFELGDYFTLNSKKWTITQRQVEAYNVNTLKVRYTLSKEYNATNSAINVNRDKRLYGIPTDKYVDRYIIVANAVINMNYKKALVKCWDDFTGDSNPQGYCLAEVVFVGKSGGATYKDKVIHTLDNYAIDIEKTKTGSTNVNVYLRYCDSDGRIDDFECYFYTEAQFKTITISNYGRLPFIPYNMNSTIESNGERIKIEGIKKDKMERIILIVKYDGNAV